MGKVGVMMAVNAADGSMSGHFGKAEWIMTVDENGVQAFLENSGKNGHAALELAQGSGCTEMIFAEIGPGALQGLLRAGIRGWQAPAGLTGAEALLRHAHGELQPVRAVVQAHRGEGGCCGGHGAGSSCCGR